MENISETRIQENIGFYAAPPVSFKVYWPPAPKKASVLLVNVGQISSYELPEIIPSFAWVPHAIYTIMSPWNRDWSQRLLRMTSFFSSIRGFQRKSAVGTSYARLPRYLGTHANLFILRFLKPLSEEKEHVRNRKGRSWDYGREITLFHETNDQTFDIAWKMFLIIFTIDWNNWGELFCTNYFMCIHIHAHIYICVYTHVHMHKKNWQYNILREIETNALMCRSKTLILPQ